MKSNNSLTAFSNFPFQPKRTFRFSWILASIFCVLPLSAYAEDIQQSDYRDSKQAVKQAEKLARRGSFSEAEEILRRVISQNGANTQAKLSLSYNLLKQKRLRESSEIALEVAKNDKTNARALALIGMSFLYWGDFKQSLMFLDTAWKYNSREALSWYGAGLIDFYENRINAGVQKLQEAKYLDTDEPDFVFSLAQVYSRAEKYKEAAEAYDRFLQIAPGNDSDRRNRIKGLIAFLRYLGGKQKLYELSKYEKPTVIAFELVRDRPVIEVRVNGKEQPLRFVLDTGSGISVISEETAKKLDIKPVSKGGMARAVGGDGKFQIVYGFLRSVTFKDIKINSIPVYIRKFHDTGDNIDGYIGLSLISKFLTTVDYPNQTFTLVKKEENAAAAEQGGIALPLRLTSSGFLSGEVTLQGVERTQNFIVDTGASISVISDDLAASEELNRFSTKEKMRVVGAAGVTEDVRSFTLPKMSFGTHSRESIKAIALDLDIINESSGFLQTGILGGNFLKNYSLTFDFQNSKVTFVPRKQ